MRLSSATTNPVLKRKIVTALLLAVSVAAFATLGDGGKKAKKGTGSVLLPYSAKTFSLRSNYNYKSNRLFAEPQKRAFITLNKVVTYQRGNASFVMPLKKSPLMGRIRFTPQP